ncbi:NAD-dependent epimerase/dehydratase family protein [Dyella sp. A6]|uniref:NAD-dependent epimerase/dehydratase family protein n=1 Tax=Dyella aluminiiresistens TaxID=3069105 RepID=UPI002E768196|nr:NAD-dependent epimerase/dehydratase family protein [Dyella sp. A6]
MVRPRALLTGHTGFTGRYVARELEQAGYQVIGIASQASDDAPGQTIEADLLDRDAVQRAVADADADVVLHLAAIAFVAHGDVDEMYRVNVVGTRNLLEALAAAKKRPERVVLASSANVYGNADVEPITEDTPPAPANDYAVSKLAMEYMASLWMDKLPITLTRPFNYTGVGQNEKFLLPKIVNHFRRGERVIELGNIDIARDFQDVRFVARTYRQLLGARSCGNGNVVNICSGVAHSLMDIVHILEKIAGYQIKIQVNPAFVRANDVLRLTGCNKKLEQLIGPLDVVPMEQTLSWMYAA